MESGGSHLNQGKVRCISTLPVVRAGFFLEKAGMTGNIPGTIYVSFVSDGMTERILGWLGCVRFFP
jgi:hypothetical protein